MRALGVLALAAVALAGCGPQGRTGSSVRASGDICKPFPTAQAATPVGGDPAASVEDCLHRWGYTLAASADPANLVAEATLSACTQALSGWNQQGLGAAGVDGAIEAPSLLTGEATTPTAEHYRYAQSRALFYVVQARAGHCAAPPASDVRNP